MGMLPMLLLLAPQLLSGLAGGSSAGSSLLPLMLLGGGRGFSSMLMPLMLGPAIMPSNPTMGTVLASTVTKKKGGRRRRNRYARIYNKLAYQAGMLAVLSRR